MVRKKIDKGPLMNAAVRALETGNARHILVWVPEESANTLKNLLELACCQRRAKKGGHHPTDHWYFMTVTRLHSAASGPLNLDISTKTPEEKKILLLLERACESGNFDEIKAVIPDTPAGEMRQRFDDIKTKRKYDGENIAAGRAYVSAFIGLYACAKALTSATHQGPEK
jgi:hypothetical protein